jgi:type I restriction enzyme S subunit
MDVPNGWSTCNLGEVCSVRNKTHVDSELYIGLEHIGQGNNILVARGNAKEFRSTKNTFKKGDVLYGKLRPLLNKVFLAIEDGYCSTDILPLQVNGKISAEYLLRVLTHSNFLSFAVATSSGTKMPRTNWSDIRDFKVLLPSSQEQHDIALILSNMDKLIQKTDQIIEQTQRLKKGLMQKLFTKGIGHREFKVNIYEFDKKVFIPLSWQVTNLSYVCDILDSQRIPIEESERKRRKGDIPYYGASGIIDYIDDFIFDEELLCLAEDGENLRSKALPLAFIIQGKTWVNNHAHVLRPRHEFANIQYLEYFLNYKSYDNYLSFTAQPKLNQESMKKIKIILPPLHEQKMIALIIINVDTKIKNYQNYSIVLEKLKIGLMQNLLTGKIRVKV